MKNSEISWIDGVPEDWDVKRFKDVAICNAGFPAPSEEFLLPSDAKEGIDFLRVSDLSNNTEDILFTKDKVRQGSFTKKFKAGTIVFPKSGESIRTNVRAILNKDMYVVSHLACLSSKKGINNKFLFYFLKLDNFENLINQTALPALGLYDIKNNKIVLPNLEKQTAIVSYLDTETSKIDRKISILEQKHEKLEEYKQSVIFETVTKGLDSNVPMKDSGIDWIGEIPAHWEVKRVKDIAKVATGQTPPREDLECFSDNFENNVLWIKPEDLAENKEISESFEYITPKGFKYIKVYQPNSIILSGIGDIGKIGLSKYVFTTNQQNHILYHCSVNYKYLFYFLKSAKKDLKQKSSGTVVPILNANKLKKIFCSSPPKEQQEKIANYLDTETSKINKKKEIIKKQIELLKEYKQTIIYEAVTGKMEIL